jgi:outer membrane autotransporter protein
MRQSSNPSARFAALARAPLAAVAGLALLLAGAARAAENVIWTHSGSGVWDTSGTNWSGTSGKFTDGDAVVFGLDTAGVATGTGYNIQIAADGVTLGAQAYAGAPSGANPGIIIGSGSWAFAGGDIKGGTFLITGSSSVTYSSAAFGQSGQRDFMDQRFDVVDDADFTFNMADNTAVVFTGSTSGTLAGGAFHTGSNSNLNIGVSGSYGGLYIVSNTTTAQGGAIHTGGDLNVIVPASADDNWINLVFISNTAGLQGGAISSEGNVSFGDVSGTNIFFTGTFSGNKSGAEGGVIYAKGNAGINASITAIGNVAETSGGVIHAERDASLEGIMTFASNTSGANGSVLHAGGNVIMTGTMLFDGNTSGSNSLGGVIHAGGNLTMTGSMKFERNTTGADSTGGVIYTGGDLTMTGSDSHFSFLSNQISGSASPQTSSLAYVGGDFALTDYANLTAEGGIAAQHILVDTSTITLDDGSGALRGHLTLTTIDASGSATPGTIVFNDAALNANYGVLAVNEGSVIEITGSAFTVHATGIGQGYGSGVATEITAVITGTAELIKTGVGVLSLTATNTYTGDTTIAEGMLTGNIPDSSTLNVRAGATYNTGLVPSGTINVPVDRTIASLNGEGYVNMLGATLTAYSGDFTGTLRNVASVIKQTTDTLTLGTGTVGNIDIQDGALNIGADKSLTVTGTTTVAATATLGVNVSDSTALYTDVLDTVAGSVINVAGIGNITSYNGSGSYTLIVTTATITGTYDFLINGHTTDSTPVDTSVFYKIDDVINTGTEIALTTSLIWNQTGTASAHGTFQINTGTFNLSASLADSTAASDAWFGGWDGQSLTKTGAGTLMLSGTNTYSGSTVVQEGALINRGALGPGDVIIQGGTQGTGAMINHGIIGGDVYNDGVFVFETLVASATVTGSAPGSTVPSGSTVTETDARGNKTTTTTSYSLSGTDDASYYIVSTTITTTFANGDMQGNLENTGTLGLNLSLDYAWSGTLSGATGIIIKTGTSTFHLNGDSTFSGTVQVNQGAFASGKAHNLDSIDTIHLPSTSGTLSLGGYNHNLKNIINDGVLSLGPAPAAGATFVPVTATITNYASGTNATGIIEVRSNYNAGLADRIVINGTATGAHTIRINDSSAATPGKSLGYIPLITGPAVVASNTDISFTGSVDVGMGRLIVARGDGISGLGADPDTWYLASGNQASNVGDAILSTASVAGLEWHYQLDNVRQRMGDLRQEALMAPPSKRQSPLAYTTVTSKGGNAWLRGNAYHLDADAGITTDAFKEDVYGLSLGYDKTHRWEDNQYLLGAYAVISNVSRDFDTRGDGRTNTYGAGLYFSYLKDNGWYGDTTLLITKNNNRFTTHPVDRPDNEITADYGAIAWGLSIEAGKIIKIKKTGWWLEPSGQAALAVINGRTYTTSSNMEVKMADTNIYQFRAGIRAGHDIPGTRLKPYIRAAIATISTNGGRIRAGSPDYPQYYTADMDGSRREAGLGVSWVIDEKSQMYLDYEYAQAPDYKRPWAFNFGYRCTW